MKPLMSVLYVDDSPLDRQLVKDALEREHGGFSVTEAGSREEFEALLEEGEYDLVLSDFNILGFEGLQVLDLVQSRRPGIPVVIVTGTGSETVAAEAIKLGAADYVIKSPQHILRLPHTIHTVLEKQRLEEEHRKWESKLKKSEERFRAIFEGAPQGLVLADETGRFVSANPVWQEMFGYGREEALSLTYRDVTLEEDVSESQEKFRNLMCGSVESYRVEKRFMRKDGSIFWGDLAVKLLDETGTGEKLALGVVTDITERREAEESLKRSEARFKDTYDRAPVMMHSIDRNSVIRNVNGKWLNSMGYERDDVIGREITSFMGPESRQRFKTNVEGFWKDREMHNIHHQYVRKDGIIIEVILDAIVIEDDDWGDVSISTARDVTELLKAEAALKESRKNFMNLVESSADGIVVLDREGRIVYDNKAAATIWGKERRQLTGTLLGVPHSIADPFETEVLRPSGEQRLVNMRASRTHWEGKPAYLIVARDVTDLQATQEERHRLITAIEQSVESVEITDENGIIFYVNPAFEKVSGYSRAEVIGKNPSVLKSGEHNPAFYKEMWRTLKSGKVWKGHLVNRRKDGNLFEEDATITPVKDDTGRVTSYVAVKRDVTEEILLRRQLQQAQKMESIATLAGGIAHDFNNLLTIASGYSELLLLDRKETSPGYHELQAINHSLSRGADLVKRILTFSRQVETFPETINLNDEIRHTHKLLTRTIPKMIEIKLILEENLKPVTADAGQIEQALLNLAVNAQHAMPDGGTLTIETKNVVLDEEYCETHIEAKPGECALLVVSDTGHGMEREVIDHIFEPFFSTKKTGEGTGLGLSMVFGIVKGHGGHVSCYSEPDVGTSFKIYLPIGKVIDEKSDASETVQLQAFGTETILLVDDEDLIRDLGTRILAHNGYKVLTAKNGKEALEVYQTRGEEISLVILDMIMPEMGGKECLERLLKIDPHIKVVVASGFSIDGLLKDSEKAHFQGFVSKPFDVKQLRGTVRKVLDQS